MNSKWDELKKAEPLTRKSFKKAINRITNEAHTEHFRSAFSNEKFFKRLEKVAREVINAKKAG